MSKTIISYDIAAIPEGTTGLEILFMRDEHQVVFYDSTKGSAPTYLNVTEEDELKFIDVKTEKGKELIEELTNK
jgi:hypothetical protein